MEQAGKRTATVWNDSFTGRGNRQPAMLVHESWISGLVQGMHRTRLDPHLTAPLVGIKINTQT